MGLNMYESQVEVRTPPLSLRQQEEEKTKSIWEKKWQDAPEQFSLSRSAKERLRIQRLHSFIQKHLLPHPFKAVDLGSGHAPFQGLIENAGGELTLLDCAKTPNPTVCAVLPFTRLPDATYDLVIATDVIQDLDSRDHRLFFSELARLVKRDGIVICSTELDVYSEDALQKFLHLSQTEFEILETSLSHHRLLCHFGRIQNTRFCQALESISQFLWQDQAISHIAWAARLKPLI